MSTRFDTYEEAYYFASTRANETGLANGIERTTEYGKDGFNVRFLSWPDKRFGWELRCEAVEPGSPVLHNPKLDPKHYVVVARGADQGVFDSVEEAEQYISWVCPSEGIIEEITETEYVSRFQSGADAAHERRMLKRQLRRAGVEWGRDLPNTAEALRDQIRALGLEPMEVCFHRSIECPACVLPAGHEGPHEPATVRTAVTTHPEPEPEPQKPVRKSTVNAPDLSLFD